MRTSSLVAAVFFLGCGGVEAGLKKQVAFDTKCPEQQVHVLDWGPQQQSAHVEACGKPLSYHAQVYGVTDTSPGQGSWVQQPEVK